VVRDESGDCPDLLLHVSRPSPEHRCAVKIAQRLVEARWTGLTRLKQEMERGVAHGANWSGCGSVRSIAGKGGI